MELDWEGAGCSAPLLGQVTVTDKDEEGEHQCVGDLEGQCVGVRKARVPVQGGSVYPQSCRLCRYRAVGWQGRAAQQAVHRAACEVDRPQQPFPQLRGQQHQRLPLLLLLLVQVVVVLDVAWALLEGPALEPRVVVVAVVVAVVLVLPAHPPCLRPHPWFQWNQEPQLLGVQECCTITTGVG